MTETERFRIIIRRLEQAEELKKAPVWTFKAAKETPFQVLVGTLLSARTRDETTTKVVKRLFQVVHGPEDLVRLSEDEIAELIYPVGFYRTKARHLKQLGEVLLKAFGGRVPDTLEELTRLPGVGRKTANIVLVEAFDKPALSVDVHVHRIANRLGLVRTRTPEETEKALKALLPDPEEWKKVNLLFVALGQTICTPRNPQCHRCPVEDLCPKIGVEQVPPR